MRFLNHSEYPLNKLSHIKVGSKADFLFFPEDRMQLAAILRYCEDERKNYYALGGGSNTLFGTVTNTVIISDQKLPWKWEREGTNLIVSGNHNINYLLVKSAKLGLKGLEFLSGIPAHVGGLTLMNAGAYQKTIFDYINWIKVVDSNGEKILLKSDIEYSYRFTNLKGFITEVSFTLEEDNPSVIIERIRDFIQKRKSSQPLNTPNIGCFFKNPHNESAGRMIDQAGLKGFTIGGAQISEKHANFIINKGNATIDDVLTLIENIKNEIFKKCTVELELEIKVLHEEKKS